MIHFFECQEIFENHPDGILFLEPDSLEIIHCNYSFSKFLGYQKEELIRKKIHLIGNEEMTKLISKIQTNKTITPQINTIQYKHKEGLFIEKETKLKTVKVNNKDLIFFHHQDNSFKIEKETNNRLMQILEYTPLMVVHLDSKFNFLFVNKAYADTCKFPVSFFPGKNHFDLYPNPENEKIFQKVVDTGEPYFVTAFEFIFPDQPERGVTLWNWSLIPVKNRSGEVESLVFTLEEVTEKFKAERIIKEARTLEIKNQQKLQSALFETMQRQFAIDQHAIVAITNLAGTITYANDRFCELSKYSKDELIGKNHRIINSGLHPKEFFIDMYSTLKQGKVWSGEIRNRAKDGSYYWVATTITPLRNEEGKIEKYCSIRTDITKRKQAEESLRLHEIELMLQNQELRQTQAEMDAARARYFDLYNMAPIGYCTLAVDGLIIEANFTAIKLLGKSLINKSFASFILQEDEAINQIHLYRLIKTGIQQSYELRLLQKDGDFFWAHLTAIVNETNGKQTYRITFTDISEKKQAESALLLSESRMQAILDNTFESIFFVDRNEKILFFNQIALTRSLAIFGKEIQPGDSIYEVISPEEVDSFSRSFKKALEGERALVDKTFLVNNIPHWFELQYAPVRNEKYEIIGVLFTVRDINETKQVQDELRLSELRFHTIFDQAPLGIALIESSSKNFIQINPNFCKILGYEEAEVLNKSIQELTHPEDRNQILKYSENDHVSFENRFIKKNGSIVWTDLTCVSLFEKKLEFELGYLLLIAIDITETKKANETLKNYMQELEQLNQTKNKFFSIIAHDLRNPFAGIIGLSEILEKKLLEENTKNTDLNLNYTRMILAASKSAFNLLENLLVWARSQTGEITINPGKMSFRSLVSSTLPIVNTNAIKKDISIELNLTENDIIYADESLVNTILRNLLTNAIKFTERYGKIILSSVARDNFLEISIADTGTGIEPKNLEKIFRIDSKFSKIGTDNEKGTGLGLILCKEFVEKLGGTIWVKSELGAGSCFTFTLPL